MSRTLNFGADATDADYQVRDTSATGGDLVIEHMPSGAEFRYNATANQWELVDPLSFGDEAADPASNGVVQRNGPDIKAFSGGSVRNLSNIGEGSFDTTAVASNTTTSGAGIYLVDTSGGAVTLTLASADATNEASIGVVNVSGANAVTVDTESTETIDPGGASSKTLSTEGWLVWFAGDGTNWDSSLDVDVESVTTVEAVISSVLELGDATIQEGASQGPFLETDRQTIDDTNRVQASPGEPAGSRFGGLIYLYDGSNDTGALFNVELASVTQITNNSDFTTTADNQGTMNVYHDGGDTTIYIENETGGQVIAGWWVVGGGT